MAAEVIRRKDCRLAVGRFAAFVGVAETTVRNAICEARKLELLTVEERQITGFRSETKIVRIVSPEWTARPRLAQRENTAESPPSGEKVITTLPFGGRGCKSAKRMSAEAAGL